jgi:hypothetical protein
MRTRVTTAVERALDARQRGATEEVEKILAAAVRSATPRWPTWFGSI